ncbi:nose resistant to fluoxetine protein 6-like [Tubulanus polymorphus]|uniref:nose resistant to fluoxetine protein 6-like n=1 Tax=Tubulanus polymorphus TaxID=672921 RepID=UPI003DA479CB
MKKNTGIKNKYMTAREFMITFSAYSNIKKLLSFETPAASLNTLNGIRFFSMCWIILGHTVSCGLLLMYLSMKQLNKVNGPRNVNWFMFYIHRIWRLTPAYMALLVGTTFLSRYFGDGPLYPNVDGLSPGCRKTWWSHLLYINNVVEPGINDCVGWTWFMANDMQYYIISPLPILAFYKCWWAGLIVVIMLCLIDFISVGLVTKMGMMTPQSPGPKFLSAVYLAPFHHVAAYGIGLATGYYLYRAKNGAGFKIHKVLVAVLWILTVLFLYLPVFGLYTQFQPLYYLNPMPLSLGNAYYTLGGATWCLGLSWLTIACETGYGGLIKSFLSWRGFHVFSKLTYSAYLLHPIVILINYNSQRAPVYASHTYIAITFMGHLLTTYLLSMLFSLAFESPSQGLESGLRRLLGTRCTCQRNTPEVRAECKENGAIKSEYQQQTGTDRAEVEPSVQITKMMKPL